MFGSTANVAVQGTHIDLPASFDFTSSARFRNQFVHLLNDPSADRVAVNLAQVTYIDSCGIGTLIGWHRSCEDQGKHLVVHNCSQKVMQTLKMLAVDRLLHFGEVSSA